MVAEPHSRPWPTNRLIWFLLDILMPEVDGIEVLKTLQADTRLSVIPVIVVSAVDDPQGIREVQAARSTGLSG